MKKIDVTQKPRLPFAYYLTLSMIFSLFYFLPSGLSAQPDNATDGMKADTTRVDLGNGSYTIIRETNDDDPTDDEPDKPRYSSTSDLTYWNGIDLGVSGFVTKDGEFNLPDGLNEWELDYSRSITVNLNFIERKLRIAKDYAGIYLGAGLEYNNYAFKNDVTLSVGTDSVVSFFDSTRTYDKNKLKATYVTFPLMLEFNTSRNAEKSVHLAAGIIGGWKIGSKWKHQYETDEERIKNKVKSHYHLNPFKYSAAVRMGYGGLTVFANYSLVSLFEKDRGPELYPFNVGVTITGI